MNTSKTLPPRPSRFGRAAALLACAAWLAAGLGASSCATGRSAGASDEATADGVRVSDYYPLAVGNRWTYGVTMMGRTERRTVEIVGRDGAYFVDSEGDALGDDGFGLRDRKRYLMKYPLAEGTEWKSVPGGGAVERYKIVAAGRALRVPAGEFADCLTVQARLEIDRERELVHEASYARGAGLIRLETWVEGKGAPQSPQVTLVLEKFEAAGAAAAGTTPSAP